MFSCFLSHCSFFWLSFSFFHPYLASLSSRLLVMFFCLLISLFRFLFFLSLHLASCPPLAGPLSVCLYWDQKRTAKCTDKSLFFGGVLLNVLGSLMFIPLINFLSFSFIDYFLGFTTVLIPSWFSRFHNSYYQCFGFGWVGLEGREVVVSVYAMILKSNDMIQPLLFWIFLLMSFYWDCWG